MSSGDERDLWITADEPSPEEFEAAEEEPRPAGPRVMLRRILRLLGVLVLIFALLLYFVVPFRNVVIDAMRQMNLPVPRLQSIPLAPEPTSTPKLPV